MIVLNKVIHPEHEPFLDMADKITPKTSKRDKTLIQMKMFKYVCGYYQEYIESLLQRIDDLRSGSSTILAEIIETKHAIEKLSTKICK